MKSKESVTRTALDALLAKWSAVSAGHRPVGKNSRIYQEMLQQMVSFKLGNNNHNKKRQTPLVNAGYAARVAAVTHMVESFVFCHHCNDRMMENPNHINLVILGCGLDVLGLWGHSLLEPNNIRVYEVDVPEICSAKQDALVSMGLLLRLPEKKASPQLLPDQVLLQGFLELPAGETKKSLDGDVELLSNYVLVSADLRDIASLQQALSSMLIDTSQPTLVVSELVMAYLGQRGTDSILKFCASHICKAPGSALIAYEPLGATSTGNSHTGTYYSVTEGYKRAYGNHFVSKLQRGVTKHTDNETGSTDDTFHPLGVNCSEVEGRLQQAGFPSSHACLAGTMAAWATSCANKETTDSCAFPSPELFDEHAALALHLRSYVVACAFSVSSDLDLVRRMCPWSKTAAINALSFTTDGILISGIGPNNDQEQQVRDLFQQTYKDLFEEYPSIKKMVTTALKTDMMSGKKEGNSVGINPKNASAIGSRYRSWGGIFLVATESSSPSAGQMSGSLPRRRVVGCIGLRPCAWSEDGLGESTNNSYEIQRLAVDEAYRGRGVGKALLAAVDYFVELALGKNVPFQLVATTPAILTAATKLYQATGFKEMDRVTMGRMVMITYVKAKSTN